MLSRFAASVSVLALLVGFVEAPHTHLHLSERSVASDSVHSHAVLHSHVTSHERDHEHDAPAGADPLAADGLSVDAFVFQLVKNHALTDTVVALPHAVAAPVMASIWTGISPQMPPDYGSPPILPSSSRAPPILPSRTV